MIFIPRLLINLFVRLYSYMYTYVYTYLRVVQKQVLVSQLKSHGKGPAPKSDTQKSPRVGYESPGDE